MDFIKLLESAENNPEILEGLATSGFSQDDIKQAMSMVKNGKFEDLHKNLKDKGFDMDAIKEKVKSIRSTFNQVKKSIHGPYRKAILINASRKLKIKEVGFSPKRFFTCPDVVELICSRLSRDGRQIKIYYDPNHGGHNRRASHLAGFRVGGNLLIVDATKTDDKMITDLPEKYILDLEKELN